MKTNRLPLRAFLLILPVIICTFFVLLTTGCAQLRPVGTAIADWVIKEFKKSSPSVSITNVMDTSTSDDTNVSSLVVTNQ